MSDAVNIHNLEFSYGKNKILSRLCARVQYSQIYALLGPSGGGKTTLLKLILGRLRIQQGAISVLGLPPGEANSNISFMPQDIGLCDNLTINQTLKYFKLIYRLSNEEFYIRRRELTTLCNLPDGHKLVGELSGGTKRRLSIVVALINNPTLVILDEPTVGIDALLRNQIWNYLVSKALGGMTMIIVTHYIEEAVNADRVGLLRNGTLLAEDNPQALMTMYQQPNLEAVFLKLCYLDDQEYKRNREQNKLQTKPLNDLKTDTHNSCFCSQYPPLDPHSPPPHHNHHSHPHYHHHHHHHSEGSDLNNNDIFVITKFPKEPDCSISNCSSSTATSTNLSATTWRRAFNTRFTIKLWILLTLIYRNINKFIYSYFSLIIVLLPATQALIFCLAVSKEITYLPAAVYNQESDPNGYGDRFIDGMKPIRGYSIQPKYYDSLEKALDALNQNKAIGAIWITENYTESVDFRIEEGFSADNSTVADSTIRIFLDNSLYILSIEFYTSLIQSFTNFSKEIFHAKDMDLLEIPINVETTSLSKNYRFNDYYMPGYFLLFLYISQITMASLTLNKERKDGLFERSLIAGVSHELVFFSHIITSLLISIIQLFSMDLIAFGWFQNPNNSSYLLKFSFFLMESLNATSLGFVISSLIDSEAACLIMVWFITIPQCLSSGILWPLESLSKPLNYIFYLWPLSIPAQTIRHIMLQGWGLSNTNVQYGFLTITLPMIILFFIALIIFKRK